ncbi:MAG TPA: matrixin family metalloprotease, partial [Polyangiaceae bacterium]
MNPIVPSPQSAPRITSKAPSVLPGSFAPAAFTNRPGESASLAPRPDGDPRPPRRDLRRFIAFAAVVVVGAVAVRFATHAEAPSKPSIVSGRAGLKHTKKGQVERWFRDRLTLTVDGSFGTLAPGAADAVQEAFGAWVSSDAQLPRLAFDSRATKNVVLAPDGENRIYYAPIRVPGHEGDLAITLGYTNDDTGEIVEADVIINSLRPFALLDPAPSSGSSKGTKSGEGDDSSDQGNSTGKSPSALTGPGASGAAAAGCADTYDLRSVVTHEAGHFFGLGEDMTDTSATMYYSTRPCDLGKRELQTDDTSQVAALYVASEGTGNEGASAQKCSVGT